jgi:hypothetical protein
MPRSEATAAARNKAYAKAKAAEKADKLNVWAAKRKKMDAEKAAREAWRALAEESAAQRNAEAQKPPRILVLDIESSPIEAYVWGLWDQNIGIDFIKTEWTILSYAAKWLGDSKILYADTGGRGADKVRDDKALVRDIGDLLNEANIVIAQNGKKFDTRKINARLIMLGILPPSPYKVVDTLLSSRMYFAFTSQKLAWTSKHLTDSPKSEHKKFPGFELWTECLADNPAAWAEMKKYNKQDVVATEKVYLRLRPWIRNHPNISAGAESCPNCRIGKTLAIGRHTMSSGIAYTRLWCESCGHWSRSKQILQPLKERRQIPVSIT